MSRHLTVLLSILALMLTAGYPSVSTAQAGFTKQEKKQIKKIAEKEAKKRIQKTLPIGEK